MNQDLLTLLSPQNSIVFILVITRIGGLFITAPLFSTFPIPVQVKAGLAAMIAFVMAPFVIHATAFQPPTDLISLTLMMFKEFAIGVLIGYCSELIFSAIQMGGQLLSIQMGLAVAESLDPVTRQTVPVIGQFYLYLASLIFIFINGHHYLFTAIYDSYSSIPMNLNFDFSANLAPNILFFVTQLFAIAFALVMPIFGLLFIVDVGLAFMAKMMPQMNIFMVGLPFKIYIGLLLMSLFMTTTASYLMSLIATTLQSFKTIF